MIGEGGWEWEVEERGEEKRDVPADQRRWYMSGWDFSSQSWHFLTVPPNSQYYLFFS